MKLLKILLCTGTWAHVAPPFKVKGGSAPVMHTCSRVPGIAIVFLGKNSRHRVQ